MTIAKDLPVYRLSWLDDSGCAPICLNPPITPNRLVHLMLGGLVGTAINRFVCAVGPSPYTLSYPTEVEGAAFACAEQQPPAAGLSAAQWRRNENLRHLWASGHDPIGVVEAEAHRIGMEFWLQPPVSELSVKHETAHAQPTRRYLGSELAQQVQLEIAREAAGRYGIDGWELNLTSCPRHSNDISTFISEMRSTLDTIGRQRGRKVGFSVRVPPTISRSDALGLNVPEWIVDGLIDIIVPSGFGVQDTEHQVSEWLALVADYPVQVCPSIEATYLTAATQGRGVAESDMDNQLTQPLSNDMIRGLAARHWSAGADGLCLSGFPDAALTFGADNYRIVHDIATPLRLEHKDKCYAVSFNNELIPARLDVGPVTLSLHVSDDVAKAGARVRHVLLLLLMEELTHIDEIHVTMNGTTVDRINPLQPAAPAPGAKSWVTFDAATAVPRRGANEIMISSSRPPGVEPDLALILNDVELHIAYHYPDGPWRHPPSFDPRT